MGDTSDLIQRIQERRSEWRLRHALLDRVSQQHGRDSARMISRSRELLERTKDLPGMKEQRNGPATGDGAG